jgi:hypothetical protein
MQLCDGLVADEEGSPGPGWRPDQVAQGRQHAAADAVPRQLSNNSDDGTHWQELFRLLVPLIAAPTSRTQVAAAAAAAASHTISALLLPPSDPSILLIVLVVYVVANSAGPTGRSWTTVRCCHDKHLGLHPQHREMLLIIMAAVCRFFHFAAKIDQAAPTTFLLDNISIPAGTNARAPLVTSKRGCSP